MIYRFFGFLCVIGAIGLGLYSASDLFPRDPWSTASPAKRIAILVEKDLKDLQKQKELPPEWTKISKTVYKFESSITKTLLAEERPNLGFSPKASSKNKKAPKPEAAPSAANTESEYELEIAVLDIPDETDPGFIFQMSLFESATKNKIYEIGRTYHWSSLNETHP